MDNEIFKIYKETRSNRYGHRVWEVSNLGRVKLNGELINFNSYKLMHGYHKVGGFMVYRAVAELFIPNPENKPCIDHINTVRTDDRVENLRWVTYKENNDNPLTTEKRSLALTGKRRTAQAKQKMKNAWKRRRESKLNSL